MLSGLGVDDYRHLVDRAVTAHAPDTPRHVGRVIEEDEIRRLVHPHPGDRLTGSPARLHQRSLGLSALIAWWQFMHVWVEGILATEDSWTPVWQ